MRSGIVIVGCAALALAACGSTAKYEENLNSFVGSTERVLVDRWGPPDSVYEAGGTKHLTYDRRRSSYIPGVPPSYQTTCSFGYCTSTPIGGSPGYVLDQQCRTTFTVTGEMPGDRRANDAAANDGDRRHRIAGRPCRNSASCWV